MGKMGTLKKFRDAIGETLLTCQEGSFPKSARNQGQHSNSIWFGINFNFDIKKTL